mgnify:FL=1
MFSVSNEITRCREQRKMLSHECSRALEFLDLELQEKLFLALRALLIEKKSSLQCQLQTVFPLFHNILHSSFFDRTTKNQAKEMLRKTFETIVTAMEIGSARGNLDKKEESLIIIVERW